MFVNRREEIDWLEERWRSGRAELLFIYGRRRVGKTRLVLEWASGKSNIFYFIADETPARRLLERLSLELSEFTGDELLAERPFTSWRQVLLYVSSLASRGRFGFILDEFQYAVKSSPELPSVLQTVWDTRLASTKAFIVLMGSLVSFVEGLLSQRSPLYGGLTGAMRVKPFGPLEAACFVKEWDFEDALRLYGVFGGVPGYLVEVDPSLSLWENVEKLVLSPNARFLDEARFLLREELREVARYYAVLEAVASGASSYGEISSKSGVPGESLSKYLRVLEEMGLVEKVTPVVGRGKARYRVADRFLGFWFRYVPRYRSAIEAGLAQRVTKSVRRDFEANVMPSVWEEAVRHAVLAMARRGLLDLTPSRVGPWWYKGYEVDLVVIDETTSPPRVLLVEAKWSSLTRREARRILDGLRSKSKLIPLRDADTTYMLAARDVEEGVDLLDDELILTLSDVAKLSMEAC